MDYVAAAVAALRKRDENGGGHLHHRDCIHNLPATEQVTVRGKTLEWWAAFVGDLPKQITSDQWQTEPPEWEDSMFVSEDGVPYGSIDVSKLDELEPKSDEAKAQVEALKRERDAGQAQSAADAERVAAVHAAQDAQLRGEDAKEAADKAAKDKATADKEAADKEAADKAAADKAASRSSRQG